MMEVSIEASGKKDRPNFRIITNRRYQQLNPNKHLKWKLKTFVPLKEFPKQNLNEQIHQDHY